MSEQKWVPFDYERYKKGDEVFHRNTEKFEGEIFLSERMKEYNDKPLILVYLNRSIRRHYLDGTMSRLYKTEEDLFMKPKTKKVWIAVNTKKSRNNINHFTSEAYLSKESLREKLLSNTTDWQIVEGEIEVNE